MKKQIVIIALLLFTMASYAQELLSPAFTFSHKKTSYVTLLDETEIQGTIKDIDRKKGLIKYVNIKDGSGKKHKLKSEEIKFMYLMPSGLDKLGTKMNFLKDIKKWGDDKLNSDFLSIGYVYFELADVKVNKKNLKLQMQLLNPGFSKAVKIYHDPFAKETTSLKVGGFKVAGGIAKSYYVAKGNQPAYRFYKKDYRKAFTPMWKSCKKVERAHKNKHWADLVKHVITFTECNN